MNASKLACTIGWSGTQKVPGTWEPFAAVCIQSAEFDDDKEGCMDILQRENQTVRPSVQGLNGSTVYHCRPSRTEAEEAVRTLIRWIGDDPARAGLADTPSRVVRAYEEWFRGYGENPDLLLRRCFEEISGYDEMVILRDIAFVSHCEHHIAAISGHAHIAYVPDQRVVGISKLARVVHTFAKRLQIQERMTAQIAQTIERVLKPRGVAVVVEATHACLTTRGAHSRGTNMATSHMLGIFRDQQQARRDFLTAISLNSGDNVRGP